MLVRDLLVSSAHLFEFYFGGCNLGLLLLDEFAQGVGGSNLVSMASLKVCYLLLEQSRVTLSVS